MRPLSLRAAFKHGVLLAAANWPVVLIDFAVGSFFKLMLTVPVLGGAVMVAAIVGSDLGALVGEGTAATADVILASLVTAPAALTSFLAALAIVVFGGGIVVSGLQTGTLTVIVEGDRRALDLHSAPLDSSVLRRAGAYSLERVLDGTARFGRRATSLALGLATAYLGFAFLFLGVMRYGFTVAQSTWFSVWQILLIGAVAFGVVAIAVVNLAFDLLRVVIVTDDCTVREAVRRLGRFVADDGQHLLGIFGLMGGVMVLATVVSLLAAAGLTVAAWLPFLGFVIVPLQLAAWGVRGLIFECLGLAALAACQTQYRRFTER